MSDWRSLDGAEAHRSAMSGRPLLAFGTPRYGPTVDRHALVYFITGHGWLEVGTDRPFQARHWMPLPAAPAESKEATNGN